MKMSHNQVQSFSKGPFCRQSDRQPAHGANFIPQNCSCSGDLLYGSPALDRLKEKSRSQRACGRDLVTEGVPPNYFLLTLLQLTHVPLLWTSHPVAAAAGSWLVDLAPAGNDCMNLAVTLPSSGGALTRRSFSAEEDRCRVDSRKGTTGLLSQETLSWCLGCYEAVPWCTDRIWWRWATPSTDCLPGQPRTNKGILAWLWHLTLRTHICSLSAPEIKQIPYSRYWEERASFIHPAGSFPARWPQALTSRAARQPSPVPCPYLQAASHLRVQSCFAAAAAAVITATRRPLEWVIISKYVHTHSLICPDNCLSPLGGLRWRVQLIAASLSNKVVLRNASNLTSSLFPRPLLPLFREPTLSTPPWC